MLYLIAQQLDFPGVLNLIRYLSFRAGAASATALLIGLLLGPWFISQLRVRQKKGQPIRQEGPQSHFAKVGTPTMGGLLILIAVIGSVLWGWASCRLRAFQYCQRLLALLQAGGDQVCHWCLHPVPARRFAARCDQ